MSLKAILCVPLGHKWTTQTTSYDVEPLLRCTRCGRIRDMGNEARDLEPGRRGRPADRPFIP